MFTVMAIKLSGRNEIAPKVQEVLTEYGCIIHTRLGLHNQESNACSRDGLILLNLISNNDGEINKLEKALCAIDGVIVKIIEI